MPLSVDLHDQLDCQKSNEGRSDHKSSDEDNRLGFEEKKGKNENLKGLAPFTYTVKLRKIWVHRLL